MSNSSSPREAAQIEQNKQRRIQALVPQATPVRPDGKKPQFIIITGQPGAGKTTTQKGVTNALGPSTATYDRDDNAKIHPRHARIMRDNGLQGQAAVERRLPDDLHEELIGPLRGDTGGPKYDVVASYPFGHTEHADHWLDGFRDRAYETTVVFVATHDTNSMLGIAHRYQQDRDDPTKGYGRWVEPRVHDVIYMNHPQVAHELESTGKVDHIYVTSRDGEVLYENHLNPHGAVQEALGAREAIIEERARTPTPQEIARFDSAVAYLRGTDRSGRTRPVADMVRMTVDYVEQEHRQLRPARTEVAAPTTSGAGRTIDAALQEQFQEPTAAAGPPRTATAPHLERLSRRG